LCRVRHIMAAASPDPMEMLKAATSSEAEMKEELIKASARIVLSVILGLTAVFFLFWPSKKGIVKQLITRERRSVVKYKTGVDGKVPGFVVTRSLEAAIHAPNHFLNEPWRFRVLGPETVKKIVVLNEAKKELFEGVPGWMLVSVVLTPGDTKWNPKALEDHAATACAVQNFMLALASEGFASKWMTGAMGIPAAKLLEVAGVAEKDEHFMGILFMGKPATPTAKMDVPKRKVGIAEPVLTRLP